MDAVKEATISLHDKAYRTWSYKGLYKHLIIFNRGFVFGSIVGLTCNTRRVRRLASARQDTLAQTIGTS